MNKTLSICSIIFCFIGSISNLISILVCLHKELRKVPTFVFLSILSFMNILKLISIGLCVYLLEFVVQKVQELDAKIINFFLLILFWEYQTTAYLKVNSSSLIFKKINYFFLNYEQIMRLIDYIMCIQRPLWRRFFNSTHAVILSITLIGLFFLLNFHLVFTVKYNNSFQNSSTIEYIYSSEMLAIWIHV